MLDSFLDDLRRPRPDPGGGAAAAHGALLAMALAEKIILVELQRRAGRDAESDPWESHSREVTRMSALFSQLRSEDVQAYHHLAEALRPGEDADRLHDALVAAIQCPLSIMRQSAEAFELIEDVGKRCRRFLVADVLVACEFLGAALLSACHIARANLPLMLDSSARGMWQAELVGELHHGRVRLEAVRACLEVRNAAGGR